MAAKVVRDSRATYRRTASNQAAHSSVWRWLTWLSALYEKGHACLRFVLSANPNSMLHRKPYSVHPWKSRSQERASVLEVAFQTLDRIMAFEQVVAEKYSPTLEHHDATA